jgi:prenyl protein peptidase
VRLVWMTPLVFGVAHVHHAWENWYRMGRTRLAAKRAVLGSGELFFATTSLS